MLIKQNVDISGSLTQLENGQSYLRGGDNVNITTSSIGQVIISTTPSFNLSGSITFEGKFLDLFQNLSSSNSDVKLIKGIANNLCGEFLFIPSFYETIKNWGLIIDIDPSKIETINLSGSNLLSIKNNVLDEQIASGSEHSPLWSESGWSTDIPSIEFSGSTWSDVASTYLTIDLTPEQQTNLTNTEEEFKQWTIFIVFKASEVIENTRILTLNTDDDYNVFEIDDIGIDSYSFDESSATGAELFTPDTNKHIIEVSSDGLGTYYAKNNNDSQTENLLDFQPKNIRSITIGATKQLNEGSGLYKFGFSGSIARILIFNQKLSSDNSTYVRTTLNTKYEIF